MSDIIFALDIGTRTVIGLVCKVSGEKIEIIAHHIESHKDRAMKDGQIHHIDKVAKIVDKIKKTLEKKLDIKLDKASIAAAGRALRTVKESAISDLSNIDILRAEHVHKVEIEALAKCKEKISREYPDEPLYCVGYSVLAKKINGFNIDELKGQRGGYVEIEIIATFLPNIVVDSLFEVLKRVGVAIESLTLEPIAAIEVAIPPKFRMLNLALVDIGAGTSDIAVSRGGTIIGYGMVQKAGDKITERLAEHYLVDFNTAEKVKLAFATKNDVGFTDILGIKHTITKDQYNETIKPAVNEMAKEISKEILSLNGKEPSAVFCVGGGSQVELLREVLANELNLPIERVAIRGRDSLENVKVRSRKLKGPEVVTPVGIAAIAQKNTYHNFLKVYVNEKETTIFNAKKTTVAQAIFTAGIKVEEVIRPPKSDGYSVTIMGEEVVIPGHKGYPGEIYLNGKKVSLEDPVKDADKIEILRPKSKKTQDLSLKKLIAPYNKTVSINGTGVNLLKDIKVNDKIINSDYIVKAGDNIEIIYLAYLSDILAGDIKDYEVIVDGVKTTGDTLILNAKSISYKKLEEQAKTTVKANGKTIEIEKEKPLIVDVFDKLDIDQTQIKGNLIIKRNNLDAGFADNIKTGDNIEIYWD